MFTSPLSKIFDIGGGAIAPFTLDLEVVMVGVVNILGRCRYTVVWWHGWLEPWYSDDGGWRDKYWKGTNCDSEKKLKT